MPHYRAPAHEPFLTEERCTVYEYLNADVSPDVSIAECVVEPGVTTQLHRLPISERYLIQSGRGTMEIDGEQVCDVRVGDCVLIPPGAAQRIHNPGPEQLRFLAICTPRFAPHHYESLEIGPLPSIGS